MEKLTQTTAATAEESAAASEELTAQAESTMGVVERLSALVGVTRVAVTRARSTSRATRPAAPVVRINQSRPAAWSHGADESQPADGTYGRF
jgi:methyl-accepting chemotaxis protein